jgi:hypothetical protein
MLTDHSGEHRRAFSLVPGPPESPHQHGIGASLVVPGNEATPFTVSSICKPECHSRRPECPDKHEFTLAGWSENFFTERARLAAGADRGVDGLAGFAEIGGGDKILGTRCT